ncbi:MAG: Trk system potassium transporter TrkA [Candidatus Hydrogenedentes bacterium]|nr:Trk system potassium transporter TrkA [Candidatus Hydrogenedentota bacterium]
MNIFIVGGGRVGSYLAHMLSEKDYDVTVIEIDPERHEQIDVSLNARIVYGDGNSALLLQSLQVGESDLFIACTGSDETNLIAAAAAKGLGARQVLARVEKNVFIEESLLYEGFMNVDYMLSPDALAAQEIVNYIIYPGILASEDFARGQIQLRQVRVSAKAPADNQLLRDILPPGSGVLLGVLERNGKMSIPTGEDRIFAGDKVSLIGKRGLMHGALQKFQGVEPRMEHIVIMGGGTIGRAIAHSLEGKVASVKLFEKDKERAEHIATGFRKANVHVVHRDATSRHNLEQEHVFDYDLFVATTEDDKRNIIAGVFAREVGVNMAAVVVHHPDFVPLVVKLGIDMVVTPRDAIANSVLKILRQQSISTSSILREGDMEVLEIKPGANSSTIGKPLRDLNWSKAHNLLIASIIRNDTAFVPGGDDVLRSGDSIVVITKSDAIAYAQRFFTGH